MFTLCKPNKSFMDLFNEYINVFLDIWISLCSLSNLNLAYKLGKRRV